MVEDSPKWEVKTPGEREYPMLACKIDSKGKRASLSKVAVGDSPKGTSFVAPFEATPWTSGMCVAGQPFTMLHLGCLFRALGKTKNQKVCETSSLKWGGDFLVLNILKHS